MSINVVPINTTALTLVSDNNSTVALNSTPQPVKLNDTGLHIHTVGDGVSEQDVTDQIDQSKTKWNTADW